MNSLINDLQLNQINASRFNEIDTNYKGVKSTYSMKPNSLNSPFMNRNPQPINVTNIPRITEYAVIDEINCDHDLGDYASDGGDGIKLIDWLVKRKPIILLSCIP